MPKLARRGILAAPLALAAAALVLAGCGRQVSAAGAPDLDGREIHVVATTGMVAELAQQIGGDRVDVESLMGPGVDPHLYKATEGDVIRLADADVVFYNGLHLEAKLAEVFERMGGRVRTYAVTDSIPRERLLEPPGFGGNYDPHVWFDVTLWIKAGERVR